MLFPLQQQQQRQRRQEHEDENGVELNEPNELIPFNATERALNDIRHYDEMFIVLGIVLFVLGGLAMALVASVDLRSK